MVPGSHGWFYCVYLEVLGGFFVVQGCFLMLRGSLGGSGVLPWRAYVVLVDLGCFYGGSR